MSFARSEDEAIDASNKYISLHHIGTSKSTVYKLILARSSYLSRKIIVEEKSKEKK
jgi:hypothetical protein